MASKQKVSMTIELPSGERHSFTRESRPEHWKSWVMQQLPYGTDVCGATFSIKAI